MLTNLCKHKEGLVDTEDTRGYFSKDSTIAIKKYQEFVESNESDERYWSDELKVGVILGGEKFIEKVKRLLREKDRDDEIPSLKRLDELDVSAEKIMEVLKERYGEGIYKTKRKYNIGRYIGIYLCKHLTGGRNVEIGKMFGIKGTAVSIALNKIENEMKGSSKLREEIEKLKSKCIN
jgi:hypothetical protein